MDGESINNGEGGMTWPPLRSLAVASLLVGREAAKALKHQWDRRLRFYPPPVVRGGPGQPDLFRPELVIESAVRSADVSAGEVDLAFKALQHLAHGEPGPPARRSPRRRRRSK